MPSLLLAQLYTRSYYTLSEAVDRVLGDLALRNTNVVTSGDIAAWMNDAQAILARETEAFYDTFPIATVSGAAEYQLPFDSGARALSVVEVLYDDRPLLARTPGQLYAYNANWRSAPAGTPRMYYQRGVSSVGLYPAPDTSGDALLVVTSAVLPPRITSPEDQFYVPVGHEDALLTYAKLQASLKDVYGEGADRVKYYQGEWKLARQRAADMVSEAQTYDIVHFGENALLFHDPSCPTSCFSPNDIATPLS